MVSSSMLPSVLQQVSMKEKTSDQNQIEKEIKSK
jgi:hypothetical protein